VWFIARGMDIERGLDALSVADSHKKKGTAKGGKNSRLDKQRCRGSSGTKNSDSGREERKVE